MCSAPFEIARYIIQYHFTIIPYWDNPKMGLMEESFFNFWTTYFMPGSLGTPRYNNLMAKLVELRKQSGMT